MTPRDDDTAAELHDTAQVIHHLATDWLSGADPEHLEALVVDACSHSPNRTFLVLTSLARIDGLLIRAIAADQIAHAEAHGRDPFFGLTIGDPDPDPDDADSTERRGRTLAMQATTAACNDDVATVSALAYSTLKDRDTGPGIAAVAVISLLQLLAALHKNPDARLALERLNILNLGGAS